MLKRIFTFFSPLMILGSLLTGILLFAVGVLLVWWSRPAQTTENYPTAVVLIIPLPTATPAPPTPTPDISAVPTTTPLSNSGEFAIGQTVQVSGTGGEGLRLRVDPSIQAQVLIIGQDGEVFQVRDGPHQVDGYIWWYLVAVNDETRFGWGVGDYLTAVSTP
jgi:hypothetical protein